MAPLETAVDDLRRTLRDHVDGPEWRWRVRGRLSSVREALADTNTRHWDGWLSARAGSSNRERHRLQARVAALGAVILDRLEPETATRELTRLLGDLEHYVQRLHDLVYDAVALELGGSE